MLKPKPFALAALGLLVAGASAVAAVLVLGGSTSAQTGSLTVTPASGPIGTTVIILGSGCNNPGQATALGFLSGVDSSLTGTLGASSLPPVSTGADGSFTTQFTIPAQFEQGSLQGRGGGPLVPGVYRFVSHPPYCDARFTVTAAGSLPITGGGPGSHGQPSAAAWFAWIGVLCAAFGALTLSAIRRT